MWDLLFCEGRVAVFCIALGILKEIEPRVMKYSRMDDAYDFLKGIGEAKLNIDRIIQV